MTGDLKLDEVKGWVVGPAATADDVHHYLFYLRDSTFECQAKSWRLEL